MGSTLKVRLAAAGLWLAFFIGSPAQAAPAAGPDAVVHAVRQMYVALASDDAALFDAVTTDDFYAFDVGKRFDGDALFVLIRDAHAAGRTFVWEVTGPEVHVDGDTAWATWVNRGSVGDGTTTRDVQWLESAVLRREGGAWRIHFFHSTRMATE